MGLDAKIIREAQAAYRQWNELNASENQQRQKAADLNRYYERVLKFEAWRNRRGSTS